MSYKILFTKRADREYKDLQRSGIKSVVAKATRLLLEMKDTPRKGGGKPEILRHYTIRAKKFGLGGWTRRIEWSTKSEIVRSLSWCFPLRDTMTINRDAKVNTNRYHISAVR
mgnify:CR=1 FL=1